MAVGDESRRRRVVTARHGTARHGRNRRHGRTHYRHPDRTVITVGGEVDADTEGGLLAVTGLQPPPVRLLHLTETYELFAVDTATVAGSRDALTA
ncbi:hypothetical protein GCM10017752_00430 [Streptomyces roseoviridis]